MSEEKRYRIQTKLSLALGLLVLISLASFGLLSYITIREAMENQMGELLVYQAEMIAERLELASMSDWLSETIMLEKFLQEELRAARTPNSNLENVILIGTDNKVLADANGELSFGEELSILKLDQVELERAWNGSSEASILYRGKDGKQHKPAYAPVRRTKQDNVLFSSQSTKAKEENMAKDGATVAVVRVEASADFFDTINKVGIVLVIVAAVITALAALAGILMARSIVNPIKKLAQASQRISLGDLDTEVSVKSKDEIGLFAQTFNQMAKNLKKLYEEIAEHGREVVELSASVAHEVRSPIHAIQGFTELLEDELGEEQPNIEYAMEHISDIKSEIQVLNSKVTDFIHFARPLVIDPYPLDIAEVLETALASTDKEIIDNNISVIKEFPENIPYAMGDFEQLRGLFINLIRNSIQAMDEGGDLCIEMESDNSDNFVRINIRDEGCGMSPEDIEMAFEPFFTKKINGTGLGLSIVKKIVDAHQGHIEIESKVGLGTIVSVFLPVEMTVHNT